MTAGRRDTPETESSAPRPPLSVYKLGGPALEDPELVAPLAADLRRVGGRLALVHGGGRQVERLLGALGLTSRFVAGRRETSPEAMQAVEMVLSGRMNKALAAGLQAAGVPAVGVSGRDGGLLRAQPVPELGCVGRDVSVAPALVLALWSAGFVPVVSPVSAGPDGRALNVNADEAALGLAAALQADRLVYLSDVDGVRVDGAARELLTDVEAHELIHAGVIAGGMALKVETALAAVRRGIPEVVVAGRARLVGGFPGTRLLIAARQRAAADAPADTSSALAAHGGARSQR